MVNYQYQILLMPEKFSFLTQLLKRTSGQDYKLAENYVLLRDMVFTTKPDAIGIVQPAGVEDVWGVIMETGYPEAIATLAVLADGSVSLYFSNGGGIIGMGSHEGPQRSAQALLAIAPRFREHCEATTKYPLPKKAHVRFYLLTQQTTLTAEALEDDLGNNRNPLSPLFHQAHELITEVRAIDERQQARQTLSSDTPNAQGQ
jgi:hypothetical protein